MTLAAVATRDAHADAFIARWQGQDGTEKANFQLFLGELCELLGVDKPAPASADNELNAYVFERRVDIRHPDGSESRGFIDLYRRGAFVLEGKQTGQVLDSGRWDKSMLRAHSQADTYIRALPQAEGKPPFLLLTDVGRSLEIHAEFSRSGSVYTPFPDTHSYRIKLEQLRDPAIRSLLATIWTDPLSLNPASKAARVTRAIANHLAELAKSLEKKHSAETVGTFLMRCLFTMFAEDVGLLPTDSFTHLLEDALEAPDTFPPTLLHLWNLMNTGGFDVLSKQAIKRFNGGLFAGVSALPLSKGQIQMLYLAARTDWRLVEPAIFGTLLERALNPNERHKLGAHYTPRAYVERLVLPTVLAPLRDEWKNVQGAATMLDQQGKHAKAIAEIRAFHTRLCGLRILDPACGSGNFLYVTLEHMKRLEGEVLNTLQDMGFAQGMLEMEKVSVNPQQFLGLELNPRAAAIAEMVLWIGYLQWHFKTHGSVAPAEPILRDFHNIENRDAVLAYERVEPVLDAAGAAVTRWDGQTFKRHPVTSKEVPDEGAQVAVLRYLNPRKAEWPPADYIIGNPPFIGAAPMRAALGDGYVEALRNTWKDVPESSDFVMYWWHKAAEVVRAGGAQRFGFITTNSLRQTFNRRVVQAQLDAKNPLSLIFAIPDHPWVDSGDGAAVRIAMTVGQAGDLTGMLQTVLTEATTDGEDAHYVTLKSRVGKLHADLTVGANISNIAPLKANLGVASRGFEIGGAGFILNQQAVQKLKTEETHKAGVIKPYMNGRDIAQTSRDVMIIDLFGFEKNEVLKRFPQIYQWLFENVKPERDQNRSALLRDRWWLHRRLREDLRSALLNIERFVSTVETSRHRFFVFLDKSILPDNKLINVALDDAFALGVLSSRLHVAWSLRAGSRLGVGNDSVYAKLACFDAFPFPNANEEQKSQIRALAEQIDAHRKRQQAAHPTLTLTNMYNVLEKLRSGDSLNPKEKAIHQQALTSILQELHDDLDRAVFSAYGWDDLATPLVGQPGATTPLPDKPEAQAHAEEELLSRLVELNTQRAAEEAQGQIRWLRPDFQSPDTQTHTAHTQDVADNDADTSLPRAVKPAHKLSWPKTMPEQVKIVRAQLAAAPLSLPALSAQFKNKPKGVEQTVNALVALGLVVDEQGVYRVV